VEPVVRAHDPGLTPPPRRPTPWRYVNRLARWLVASYPQGGQASSLNAYRKSLIDSGAVKVAVNANAAFQLRNGVESCIYIDHGDILCQPETNSVLVSALIQYLKNNFEPDRVILVNVDSKTSPQLTGAIAIAGGFRQILVLPETVYHEERGTRRRMRFPDSISSQDMIVIIDDVLTPYDTTALNVAKLVRSELDHMEEFASQGTKASFHLMVALVRDESLVSSLLKKWDIKVHWLATLEDVIASLWPRLAEEQRIGLTREMCDV
jgi:orotate phosphoribosyltransferase